MNRYLVKIAKQLDNTKEKPHVLDALKKLDKNKGVITHWSTGSGKTRGFLLAVEKAQKEDREKPALIIAPASLTTNIDKEIEKHKLDIDKKRLDVFSYEKAVRIADKLKGNKYSIAIADEAQKLRNADTKRTKELKELFQKSDKRLLATATANFNHVADIAPMLNMVSGEDILPEDRKKFEKKFVGKRELSRSLKEIILRKQPQVVDEIKNKGSLGRVLKKYVSYYDANEDPNMKSEFPEVSEKTVEVEMSPHQLQMYKFMEGQIPFWLRMKIRNNLPLDKKEKAELNSFSSGVRQVSNSHRHLSIDPDKVDYTPKISVAVNNLKKRLENDKNFKGLVYSNFLDAGVHEYSKKLKEDDIPHVVFTGELSKQEKDKAVKDYNSGKVKVLLVSSSGSEGLDLKGTKLTQVLEPHFNKAKIKQVTGRGARMGSHKHLPKEEQNMEVEHYLTVYPRTSLGKTPPTSIDKYLTGMSDDKQILFDEIKELMK